MELRERWKEEARERWFLSSFIITWKKERGICSVDLVPIFGNFIMYCSEYYLSLMPFSLNLSHYVGERERERWSRKSFEWDWKNYIDLFIHSPKLGITLTLQEIRVTGGNICPYLAYHQIDKTEGKQGIVTLFFWSKPPLCIVVFCKCLLLLNTKTMINTHSSLYYYILPIFGFHPDQDDPGFWENSG